MAIKLCKLCQQSVYIVLIHIIVADFVFPWKVIPSNCLGVPQHLYLVTFRWGLTFLLCLLVAIPTTVINFVPDHYPLNITLSHFYTPTSDTTTTTLDIKHLLLLLLATFIQVQWASILVNV